MPERQIIFRSWFWQTSTLLTTNRRIGSPMINNEEPCSRWIAGNVQCLHALMTQSSMCNSLTRSDCADADDDAGSRCRAVAANLSGIIYRFTARMKAIHMTRSAKTNGNVCVSNGRVIRWRVEKNEKRRKRCLFFRTRSISIFFRLVRSRLKKRSGPLLSNSFWFYTSAAQK